MDPLSELLNAGRFDEAIALAAGEVRARPHHAPSWARLAHAQLAAGRPEAALASCRSAQSAQPDDPDLLCAEAAALRALNRPAEARGRYAAAIAARPHHEAAGLGLAALLMEAGLWADARACLERLSPLLAERPDVRWLAARIALGEGALETARRDLAALADDARLTPPQRAECHLLLSQACDALANHDAAFDHAARGKGLQRALFAERAAGREAAAARFRRLGRWFAAAAPTPAAPSDAPGAREPRVHAFLVGFPRSGTTLLEQALAGSPEVVTLEEAPTLAAAHAEFLASPAGLKRLADLSPAEAQHWRKVYWSEVRARGLDPAGRAFVDKAPAGTEDLPLVARLFPQAKVLFAIRDPRDVVLSCFRQNFQMNALTYAFTDLASAAEAYDACMALAETYRRVLPLALLEVRHEDLIADFEAGLRRICAFLDLPFDARMADPATTARTRSVLTPSAPQVRAGLNLNGVGRWRRYAPRLEPIAAVLAPWVARFGYGP